MHKKCQNSFIYTPNIERKRYFDICRGHNALDTVKPVLSDHIQQNICLTFQTGGCLMLHESIAESLGMRLNHLSIAMSMSPEWVVA